MLDSPVQLLSCVTIFLATLGHGHHSANAGPVGPAHPEPIRYQQELDRLHEFADRLADTYSTTPRIDTRLGEAWTRLREGDPDAAIEIVRLRVDENDTAELRDEANMLRGLAAIKRGEFYSPFFHLEKVIRQRPTPDEYQDAIELEYLLIRVCMSSDFPDQLPPGAVEGTKIRPDRDEIWELLIRVQERLPGSKLAERAFFDLGTSDYREGRFVDAAYAYELFAENYPKSELVDLAHDRITLIRTDQHKDAPLEAAMSRSLIGDHASVKGQLDFGLLIKKPGGSTAPQRRLASPDEILDGIYGRGTALLDGDGSRTSKAINSGLDRAWLAANLIGLQLQRADPDLDELSDRISQMASWTVAATPKLPRDVRFRGQQIKLLGLAVAYAEAVNNAGLAVRAANDLFSLLDPSDNACRAAGLGLMTETVRLPSGPEVYQQIYPLVRAWYEGSGNCTNEDLLVLDLFHGYCLVRRGFPGAAMKAIENIDIDHITDQSGKAWLPEFVEKFSGSRAPRGLDVPEACTKKWMLTLFRHAILINAAPTEEERLNAWNAVTAELMSVNASGWAGQWLDSMMPDR